MPGLDGFAVLERIKADPALRHVPVIVISSVEETDSVARCIEMGATDYLPKPFSTPILRARVNASLAEKRLRDFELEYLREVATVTNAAVGLESGEFSSGSLSGVAGRSDALGQLARTFQSMADEVIAREARLRAEVRELRIEIDEVRQAPRSRRSPAATSSRTSDHAPTTCAACANRFANLTRRRASAWQRSSPCIRSAAERASRIPPRTSPRSWPVTANVSV